MIYQKNLEGIMQSKILNILKENQDSFVSGETISNQLNISRQSVSKHIKKLKETGYSIESISKKGHRFTSEGLSFYQGVELMSENKALYIPKSIIYLDSVDSTNNYLKNIALKSEPYVVVLSDEQTLGKGRLGRNWASQKGSGIFMSLLLKPDIEPAQAPKITLIAAAAMTKALESVCQMTVGVKWPNDLVINQKKVCGVLTEMSAELGSVNYVIVGIGVNVNQKVFPDSLTEKATSLYLEGEKEFSRKKILLHFFMAFEDLYMDFINNGTLEKTLDICRDHSVLINKEIYLETKANKRMVKVLDFNDEGQMIVLNEFNEKEAIYYGEVSVRGLYGYVDER